MNLHAIHIFLRSTQVHECEKYDVIVSQNDRENNENENKYPRINQCRFRDRDGGVHN